MIDTLSGTVIGGLLVDSPYAVVFNPTGTRAYITSGPDGVNGAVQVVDTDTLATTESIPVGQQPVDALMSPDGRLVLVTNFQSGTISVIGTSENAVIGTMPIGQYPSGLGFSR